MEIHKIELKRQLMAVAWVVCALYLLFDGARITEFAQRIFAELSSDGFCVSYYSGVDFEEPLCQRSERYAIQDYPKGQACFWGGRGAWSARWEGILSIQETSEYSFYLQSIGGSRLFIDDKLVINHWDNIHWNPGQHEEANLARGEYRIRLEYYRQDGPAAIRLKWAGGSIPANTLLGVPSVRKPTN